MTNVINTESMFAHQEDKDQNALGNEQTQREFTGEKEKKTNGLKIHSETRNFTQRENTSKTQGTRSFTSVVREQRAGQGGGNRSSPTVRSMKWVMSIWREIQHLLPECACSLISQFALFRRAFD